MMARRFNISEVLRNHTQYKSGLLRVYKYLERQNENNLELMKLIKPMLEKSDVEEV